MNEYHNGKIVRFVKSLDIGHSKCNVDSTCESLSQRRARHGWKYTQQFQDNGESTRSYLPYDEYGIGQRKTELIEHFKPETEDELLKQEGVHIQNNDYIEKEINKKEVV